MNFYIVESCYEGEDSEDPDISFLYKKGFLDLDKAKEYAEVQIKKGYKEYHCNEEPDLFDEELIITWKEVKYNDPETQMEEKYWWSDSIADTTSTDYFIHLITTD